MSRPDSVAALVDAASAEHQAGRRREARKLYEKALRAAPRDRRALHLLSILSLEEGELEKGVQLIRRAIAYHPDDAGAYNNLGNALSWGDRPAEAVAAYDRAVALRPDYADAHAHRGMALAALGRLDEAVASYSRALTLNPNAVPAWKNLALALVELGRFDEALRCYDQAVALAPDMVEAHFGRGNCLTKLGRLEEAVAACDRVLAIDPGLTQALGMRGSALQTLRRPVEALASFDTALAIDPGFSELRCNRANALMDLHRFDEALAEYDRGLSEKPGYADGWSNRGTVLQELGRLDEAMADYRRAIAMKPTLADPHLNLGLCLLLLGDYAQGLELAEWRWNSAQGRGRERGFTAPQWTGEEDIAGKTVLLWSDQGFGDTLQFSRYAPLVTAKGGEVVLEVQPALVRLIAGSNLAERLLVAGAPPPPVDFHCPLATLPLAFQTRLETIPPAPYVATPPAQAAAWAARLGPRTRPRIGLVWSGNRQNKVNVNRLVALEALLAAMPENVELFNLQLELQPGEAPTLEAAGVRRVDRDIVDFADTAGLLAQLDLVVTVDTSMAHLAGALGRPAWVLLHFVPDWRWMMGREDSPWYASLRLFRQQRPADWTAALQKLRAELAAWAARG